MSFCISVLSIMKAKFMRTISLFVSISAVIPTLNVTLPPSYMKEIMLLLSMQKMMSVIRFSRQESSLTSINHTAVPTPVRQASGKASG
ncbi:hypothetical protein SDC9_143276 [bioreactor metagenome]|uniref:Uncharacterized protein n=1 Tax=bioreactor metagenome TaxID=1076179 RepID=A0A645E3J7_9ZZZZ